jgi:hypothetical protein
MIASRLTNNLTGIVAGFTAAIVAIYAWLIPSFFNGYKSYSFLIVGVCGAALLGEAIVIKQITSQENQQSNCFHISVGLPLLFWSHFSQC